MSKAHLASLLAAVLFIGGCATYKFQQGEPPHDKGYVVSRADYVIPEYTIGNESTVPADMTVARQRFQRRRPYVEDYYKRMGLIENRFKENVWDRVAFTLKFFGGIFKLPFLGISDYKYEHDPVYREKIRKEEEEKAKKERERINQIKGELKKYIQQDLERENRK